MSDSFRQRDVVMQTGHRPWPLPEQPWFMGQIWLDLLFAHWRVPEEVLRRVVPRQLPLDTYDGSAWLGVTPFLVRGLRLRGTAPVPVISSFPEINVRTYVRIDDKPGIYFLSLDAASWPAVATRRGGPRATDHPPSSRPAIARKGSCCRTRQGPLRGGSLSATASTR